MRPYYNRVLSLLDAFLSHPLTRAFFKRIFFIKKNINPPAFYAKAVLYFILLFWSLSFFNDRNFVENPDISNRSFLFLNSFLDRINLVFHEAGHVVFIFFGDFIHALGGALLEALIPLIIMGHFLRQKENFSAGIGLWWFGQSLTGTAAYVYDAMEMKLQLLGGGTGWEVGGHDFRYILTELKALESHSEIAWFIANTARFVFILSAVWGGVVLYKQFLILKANNFKPQPPIEELDFSDFKS